MFMKSMFALVLSLTSSVALAQAAAVSTDAEIAAAKLACEKQYNPNATASTLKVSVALGQTLILSAEKCKLEVDVIVLQLKAQASGAKNQFIEEALRQLSVSLAETNAKLKALESAPKAIPPPADVTPIMPAFGMPVFMSPPPQVVQPPGQYAVATVPLQGMVSPVQIHNLSRGAAYWIGENQEIRVEFVKNGQILIPAQPAVFELFYSPNKKGAPTPHRGIDPATTSTVFTSCQLNDDIQVIYYTWDGSFINGTSYPAWKRVAKVQFFNFGPKYNQWKIDAITGLKTP